MDNENQTRFDMLYEKHCMNLKLQGKAEATIDSYSRALRRFTEFLDKSPDQGTEIDLKKYFYQLTKTHSWSTVKIDRVGLQFFYKYVMKKDWVWIDIVRPPKKTIIPNVLTMNEVQKLLNGFTKLRYQAFFYILYSMGLRISEGLSLQVGDILDCKTSIHIRLGKGEIDRIVPLPKKALWILRQYWRTHRHPVLMFPAIQINHGHTIVFDKHMDIGSAQAAMTKVVKERGFKKKISAHSLRHSYATHLLQLNVNIITVKKILGHKSIKTTEGYLHIAKPAYVDGADACNKILGNLSIKWTQAK